MNLSTKSSRLAQLAAGIGSATALGFGVAFGKDLYKKTKYNLSPIAVTLAVVLGPFFGGRGLVRGHDRGWSATILFTIFGNLILIGIGFCGSLIVMHFARLFLEIPEQSAPPIMFMWAVLLTLVFTAIGVTVGLLQRPKRLKAIAIGKENTEYLKDLGFMETDGSDITHYDSDGQPLRFLEAHPDRLVFMAVGRRGKRSFIKLDPNGRMIEYSGVIE